MRQEQVDKLTSEG
jgi:hypothetical protein